MYFCARLTNRKNFYGLLKKIKKLNVWGIGKKLTTKISTIAIFVVANFV